MRVWRGRADRAGARRAAWFRWTLRVTLGVLLAAGDRTSAAAQELEPGAYAVAPVGVNVVIVSNTFSLGDVGLDPSAPFEDGRATINNTVVGYGRTLNVAGRSAQASIGVPFTAGHIEATIFGSPEAVTRVGAADPRVRFAINLYGAPAMDLKTFATTTPKRLLGASLTVSTPIGAYSSDRLINLGTHRWAFKPEIGFSQIFGRWIVDTYAGVWLFTTNDNYFNGRVREQAPITSLQFHVHYALTRRLILSGNANFYDGGQTTVNGQTNFDLQRNSRVGATLVRSLSKGRTLRFALSTGAVTTIGGDFSSLSFSFQKAWGAGL